MTTKQLYERIIRRAIKIHKRGKSRARMAALLRDVMLEAYRIDRPQPRESYFAIAAAVGQMEFNRAFDMLDRIPDS